MFKVILEKNKGPFSKNNDNSKVPRNNLSLIASRLSGKNCKALFKSKTKPTHKRGQ